MAYMVDDEMFDDLLSEASDEDLDFDGDIGIEEDYYDMDEGYLSDDDIDSLTQHDVLGCQCDFDDKEYY